MEAPFRSRRDSGLTLRTNANPDGLFGLRCFMQQHGIYAPPVGPSWCPGDEIGGAERFRRWKNR